MNITRLLASSSLSSSFDTDIMTSDDVIHGSCNNYNYSNYNNNNNDVLFLQLYERFPYLNSFYFEYEKLFDSQVYMKWTNEHWMICYVIIFLYLLGIRYGTRYMENRKPMDLKYMLAGWNFTLALFSTMGMLRTVPHLISNLLMLNDSNSNSNSNSSFMLKDLICSKAQLTYSESASGFWVMLFIFSKIPELMDTVFLILRKRKLLFLHYFHHASVLLYCWHAFATASSTGLIFVALNYSVHSLMYGYYFLVAIQSKPHWLPPIAITISQISQMIIGVIICYISYLYMVEYQESYDLLLLQQQQEMSYHNNMNYHNMKNQKQLSECSVMKENVLAGGIMYASYFYLFSEFAVKRYILGTTNHSKAKNCIKKK